MTLSSLLLANPMTTTPAAPSAYVILPPDRPLMMSATSLPYVAKSSFLASMSARYAFMVGPSRKRLVVGPPKHTRLEPAAQHPWRPDPADDRAPVGPGDVITSVNRAASGYPIIVGFTFSFLDFIIQAHKHGPQEIVRHIHAVGHALADFAGFFEQAFSFGFFHNSTVFGGLSNKNVQGLQA